MRSFFSKPQPIEVEITIERDDIVETVVSILNKIAEARYDGQNAQYVNNMQPEVDFEQDRDLVYGWYNEGINNIAVRIEPYVVGYSDAVKAGDYVFSLRFPEDWKSNFEVALEDRMEQYLVHYIIASWLEKVSIDDAEWTKEKAAKLLGKVKLTCEMRKGKVHRIWNGTY